MVIHSKGKNNIYKIFFDDEDVKVHWTQVLYELNLNNNFWREKHTRFAVAWPHLQHKEENPLLW